MKKWLRRIRGALGMGLTWAFGWTLIGMSIVVFADRFLPGFDASVVDIWLPVFAYPAFLGGVTFSAVLAIAGGRRSFDEMSLPRFAAWGALGGGLLSAFIMTVAGFAPWSLVIGGIVTLLCTASAAGSLTLARMAEDRESLDASADVAEVGLATGEAQELLEGGG